MEDDMGMDMSPEVFQNKLWTWMEEKGVFSEMKTHLRRQMIDVLKASELGETVHKEQQTKRRLSPKYRAINLLIAEYLLQQGYQYALSIFSAEDPTLSILPDQISNNFHKLQKNDQKKDIIFKFLNEDVWDILETLGLPKDSQEIKSVYENYYSPASKDTLIICLIRSLSVLVNKVIQGNIINYTLSNNEKKSIIEVRTKSTQTEESGLIKEIDQKFYEEVTQKIRNEMQIAFDDELKLMRKSERKRFLNQIKSFETEMLLHIKKEKIKLNEKEMAMKNNLRRELETELHRLQEKEHLREIKIERNLQKDLETERQKLFEQYRQAINDNKNLNTSTLMELQQASLEAALKAVQHQSNRLKKKEDLLDKKISTLNRTKDVVDFSCQVVTENNGNSENRININRSSQTDKNGVYSVACQADDEENKVNTLVQTIACLSNIGCQTESESTENDKSTHKYYDDDKDVFKNHKKIVNSLQNLLRNLQKENSTLKEQILQQRAHINEMNLKYSSMTKEVSEARLEAQELSKQLIDLEKSIPDEKPMSSKQPKCVTNVDMDTGKKLKLQRTEYKFTDKGLEKIKETLKMLEKEGEELDKSYREFKLRQLDEMKSDFYKRDNLSSKSYGSISSSSVLLKHLQDKKTRESHFKGKNDVINFGFSTDWNNFYLPEKNIDDDLYNRSINFNWNKNVFQNYHSISNDMKMYNSNNPKAFADMLMKRHAKDTLTTYGSNKSIIDEMSKKKSYSTRMSSFRIKDNRFMIKNDSLLHKKYYPLKTVLDYKTNNQQHIESKKDAVVQINCTEIKNELEKEPIRLNLYSDEIKSKIRGINLLSKQRNGSNVNVIAKTSDEESRIEENKTPRHLKVITNFSIPKEKLELENSISKTTIIKQNIKNQSDTSFLNQNGNNRYVEINDTIKTDLSTITSELSDQSRIDKEQLVDNQKTIVITDTIEFTDKDTKSEKDYVLYTPIVCDENLKKSSETIKNISKEIECHIEITNENDIDDKLLVANESFLKIDTTKLDDERFVFDSHESRHDEDRVVGIIESDVKTSERNGLKQNGSISEKDDSLKVSSFIEEINGNENASGKVSNESSLKIETPKLDERIVLDSHKSGPDQDEAINTTESNVKTSEDKELEENFDGNENDSSIKIHTFTEESEVVKVDEDVSVKVSGISINEMKGMKRSILERQSSIDEAPDTKIESIETDEKQSILDDLKMSSSEEEHLSHISVPRSDSDNNDSFWN